MEKDGRQNRNLHDQRILSTGSDLMHRMAYGLFYTSNKPEEDSKIEIGNNVNNYFFPFL